MQKALRHAEQERDAALAAQPQAAGGSTQSVPDQGTQQLRQELTATKQELEQLRARTSAPANADEVAKLQSQLQEAQAALRAQQAVVPVSDPQARVIALEQECYKAQACIQELLDQGQTLQNRYLEVQNQKTSQVTQLKGQLKVGQMEMEALRKQLAMESEFSGKRAAEIDHLGEEIKQLNSENDELTSERDKLMAELQSIKNAPPPAAAPPATYPPAVGTGVPPGSQYGSSLPSHAQMLGQYSPNIPPYGLAATQVAYAAPGGQAQSYGSPQHLPPPPAHQYQGSLQQVAMNLLWPLGGLRPESPMAPSSNVLSQKTRQQENTGQTRHVKEDPPETRRWHATGLQDRKTVMFPDSSGMKGQYAKTANLFIQRICGGTLSSSFGTFPGLRITLPSGAGTFTRLTDLELLPGPRMELNGLRT